MEAFTLDSTEIIVLATAGGLFLIQIIYYLCLYNRIHARSRAVKQGDTHFTQELPPISVIICAREESENLRRNLGAVLEQDYPQFEVIVINDGNTDESEDYLTILEEKYPHLYHSFVPDSSRYISRKKLAVTLGIKASKYEWLVFTNANCMPQSNQWLRLMARNFTSRTQVVLGYSGYERGKGWLHKPGLPEVTLLPTERILRTPQPATGRRRFVHQPRGYPGEHAGRNGCQCHCAHAAASAYQGLERRENRLRLHSTAVSWNATLAGRF